jgi:hypothetical protein
MGGPMSTPLTPEEHLKRIESKIDRLLFLFGEGCGRTTAEINRIADADFLRLQARQEQKARKEERKRKKE